MNVDVKMLLTEQNGDNFWFTYVVRISTSVDTPVRCEQLSDTFSRSLQNNIFSRLWLRDYKFVYIGY
jgi:hypothetical protein